MKDLVRVMVNALVEYPDEVRVVETQGHHTLFLELYVAKSDVGRIIGKQGKIINAIRLILMSIASTKKMRVTLDVIDHLGQGI